MISTLKSVLLLDLLMAASGVASLGAQQVETPVPFDSAGQVMVITPQTASRLRLGPPGWPVTGDFTEARVYIAGENSFVLVVERPGGSRERRSLNAAQYEGLRGEVSSASPARRTAPVRATPAPATGQPPAPPTRSTTASAIENDPGFESARSRLSRNMIIAAATIYGPAAAVIVDDAAGGIAAYLGVVGSSFFASYAATRNGATRAQSDLASDFAVRGAGAGWLLANSFGLIDNHNREIATSIFFTGIASTFVGYNWGRGMTSADARATTFGSTAAALTAVGLMGSAGSLGNHYSRNDAAAILLAGVAGLPLGLAYERSAPYTITPGDISAIAVGGLIGALTGVTITSQFHDPSEKEAAAAATFGWVSGLVAGDMLWARPYDHSPSEGNILGLGALAGAAVGAAPFVIANKNGEGRSILIGATLGAYLGAWGTTVLSAPKSGTWRTAMLEGRQPSLATGSERGKPTVTIDFTSAALAATGKQGTFPFLKMTF